MPTKSGVHISTTCLANKVRLSNRLRQTLVKNFIYYRFPFCLRLSDRVYFVIQTPNSSLNLMS